MIFLKKNLKKTSKNMYLEILFSLFPLKINVPMQPLGAAVRNFAGDFRSYIRANCKKN